MQGVAARFLLEGGQVCSARSVIDARSAEDRSGRLIVLCAGTNIGIARAFNDSFMLSCMYFTL